MKKLLIGLAVIVIVGSTAAFYFHKDSDSPIETVRVAYVKAIADAPFDVAYEKKYFEEQGLRIELISAQSGDEALKALVSKSAPITLAGIVPYSFVALDNPNINIIGTAAYAHDNQIIARTDRGISKPEDIKGKKIAYTKTTASDIGLEKFLAAHGLKKSDVELINLKPLAMPSALAAGQIDAYSSWEPNILNGENLLSGKTIVFTDTADTYTWEVGIIADKSYIVEHPETMKKFARALEKGAAYIKSDPESAQTIVAAHTSIPEESIRRVWHKFDFSVGLSADLESILAADLVWANDQRDQKAASLPNPANLIDHTIYAQKNY